MTSKRLFRQEHPVLLGFVILGCIFLLFWAGITFFIVSVSRSGHDLFKTAGVGIVDLKGAILSSEDAIATLREFRQDEKVRAIVLRVDSPGGAVGASQEIFTEVRRTDAVKPVVASMASIAASGGYYAALGARRILANPGTLTGSIGVIVKFANLQELFNKIGYKSQVVKSGRLKDIGSPDRPLSEEERSLLQNLIDEVHGQFVQAVADRRQLPLATVQSLADGRIFSGQQALELGLVDDTGNFTDAVLLAARLAEMQDPDPELIYPAAEGFSLPGLLAEKATALLPGLQRRMPFLSYEWPMR